jgi:uncharacterized protein YjbI with pentapeptide repeats
MDQARLDLILKSHNQWLVGNTDCVRARLVCTYLDGLDFNGADLNGADLRFSSLYNSKFYGTDLCGANFIHAKGITLAQDGYYTMMLVHGDVPMIKAGCRWLTIAEADAHWGEGNEDEWTEHTAEYGESQRAMLAYLKSRIK